MRKKHLQRCFYSLSKSGNIKHCPHCKAERISKTYEERVKGLMERVEAKDAGAMNYLANYYYHGNGGSEGKRTIYRGSGTWVQ